MSRAASTAAEPTFHAASSSAATRCEVRARARARVRVRVRLRLRVRRRDTVRDRVSSPRHLTLTLALALALTLTQVLLGGHARLESVHPAALAVIANVTPHAHSLSADATARLLQVRVSLGLG